MSRSCGRVNRVVDDIIDVLSIVLVVCVTVGLVLAMAGHFFPVLFVLVATPCVVGGWWWLRRTVRRDEVASPAQLVSTVQTVLLVFVLVVVAAVTVLNLKSSAEHLQTDRDPGVYLTTGKWLANRGTLLVDGTVGGFSGVEHVVGKTGGYHEIRDDGLLYAQFNHGFSTILALADWVGGDRLMLNLNPLIGGLFLLLLFVLLLRLFSLWIAVMAFLTAAWNLVFWFFARDTYSEPLVALLLVMALIAAYRASQEASPEHWVMAGALVGVTALVRIDASIYLSVFALIIGVEVLRGARFGGSLSRRLGFVTLVVMWSFGILGYLDLRWRSPQYLSDLNTSVTPMLFLAFVSGALALGCLLFANPNRRLFQMSMSIWVAVARYVRLASAVGLGVFMLWAVFVRPHFSRAGAGHAGPEAGLVVLGGVPVDELRLFVELSGRWLTWYWGIPAVLIASAGSVLALARGSFPRRDRFWMALTLCGVTMIPFLVKPSITPDQIWALRRFYPMALIGLAVAIGAAFTLVKAWEWRSKAWKTAVTMVGALLVTVMPLGYALPLATASTQVGMYGSTQELCAELPENAAILMDPGLLLVFPAAVRSFCDVPVASLTSAANQDTIDVVGQQWDVLGRTLYLVVSPTAEHIPRGEVVAESWFDYTYPERTLAMRPSTTATASFGWILIRWGD